jgi:polyisoprenoid-binding protein YceI
MKKKILIVAIVLFAAGAIAIYAVMSGEYESDLTKSEVEETIEFEKEDTIQPVSMDLLLGDYFVKSGENESAEILFTTDGLKTAKGAFKKFEINLSVPDDYHSSTLDVVIETKSLTTGNSLRDEHLLEEDFFHSSKYPKIEYHSTSIMAGDTSYIAKGELTLNGSTKNLDVPFLHTGKGNKNTEAFEVFEGSFEFDRTAYGQEASSGVGNIVKVTFYCELKIKK